MERFFSFQRPSKRGLIPLLLFFLLIPQASGIGVGASPDRIDFGAVSLKEGVVRELYVINTDDEIGQILLTAEGVDLIMDPQEFGLGARESRVVNVSIDQKEPGEYKGSILITTRPYGDDSGGLGLGAGVRVPVSFIVKDEIYIKTLLGAGGALITIAVVLLLWMRRSKV